LLRNKQELIAENAFLRQQVIVLKRQSQGRPAITQRDLWGLKSQSPLKSGKIPRTIQMK
jgi:hypothetical protein